ncbi:M20/M25/M40 family metallo-hydrolase [Mangrovivirga sp. M17]|uniref:M20/M25/M40 family metallo-hydrolase n=1 Tax=Mangrovivirga halotolerans TaxID=2993936 RepID=A0ABT3RWD1_9BACT|nr:M20/M25/M40 family metallo-hydrolase [Mangrovivirga halotolerans]MCX2746090.1 M20/M25/M40 family metallo-hydrolase [Mangrovivirga halotolerans]
MRKRVKVFYVLLGVFVFTLLVLLIKTFMFSSKQPVAMAVERKTVEETDLAQLSKLLRLKTVSYEGRNTSDSSDFDLLLPWIKANYPVITSQSEIKVINNSGILIKVDGQNKNLKPDLFAAHLDVVPLAENQLDQWVHPPFAGEYDEKFVYGRGTLDDKGSAFLILEAAESLLSEGKNPTRTIYLAFGFDEEIGGNDGAKAIANYLKDQGVNLRMALDEGSIVTKGIVPGLDKNTAIVGIAEKGYVTYHLEAVAEAGHSSMPARDNAINQLTEVLDKIRKEPFKARISVPLRAFIEYLGPEMPFPQRLVFANTWLFDDLLISTYEEIPSGNAMVRTTSAVTILDAGVKDNVVPAKAEATINFRILPGENIKGIENYLNKVTVNTNVKIKKSDKFAKNPSKISNHQSESFVELSRIIAGTFDNTVVVPGLVIAGTDGRHYEGIAENVYRFSPFVLENQDLERIHGNNEMISIDNLNSAKTFFYNVMAN